jgi:hypothetical protein
VSVTVVTDILTARDITAVAAVNVQVPSAPGPVRILRPVVTRSDVSRLSIEGWIPSLRLTSKLEHRHRQRVTCTARVTGRGLMVESRSHGSRILGPVPSSLHSSPKRHLPLSQRQTLRLSSSNLHSPPAAEYRIFGHRDRAKYQLGSVTKRAPPSAAP